MKNYKSFTLIDVLMYISIISILFIGVSVTFNALVINRHKHEIISEVEDQAIIIQKRIENIVANTNDVNIPSSGSNSTILDVQTYDNNHIIISYNNSTLYYSDDFVSNVTMNSELVHINNFVVTNISTSSKDTLLIEFGISFINVSGKNEYNYSQTYQFTTTISP